MKLNKIKKSYENTCVLNEVSLEVAKGEVCVLLGENGSGKSTLAKILSGAIMPDSGDIIINGRAEKIKNTRDAKRLGIGVVYQHTVAVNELTVYENVFLGMEEYSRSTKLINDKKMLKKVETLIGEYGFGIGCRQKASGLTFAQKQYIQLLRLMIADTDIVIFDEITAPLTDKECQTIFRIVREFREQGKCIIFITHKPTDVKAVGNSIYILKDGEVVGIRKNADMIEDELIQMMLGKDIKDHFPKLHVKKGEELLRVENLSNNVVHDISFNLFLDLSINHNISISSLKSFIEKLWLNKQKEAMTIFKMSSRLGVRGVKNTRKVRYLSSGNRQKVNLARWMMTKSHIYIFDEPTMGVDINGKVEIYYLMKELIRRGAGIIMVSSNLAEVAGMCERILVIKSGYVRARLARAEATQEKIFKLL